MGNPYCYCKQKARSDFRLEILSENEIILDGMTLREHEYAKEKELEDLVVSHSKEVFGPNALYFDLKQRLTSKLKPRITDGLLLDFKDTKSPNVFVVEYELASHDLEEKVIPQLRGFVKSFESEETIAAVREAIYRDISSNAEKLGQFRRLAGSQAEVYLTIDQALHRDSSILLVFDRTPPDIQDVFEASDFGFNTTLMEFRTFEARDRTVHLVSPLHTSMTVFGRKQRQGKEHVTKPDYAISWDARFKWASPPAQRVAEEVIHRLKAELPSVFHRSRYKWQSFYVREPMVRKNDFATLLIGKNRVNLSIRINPKNFSDPEELTRPIKGFFYPRGTERRMLVTKDNIGEVIALAKLAFENLRKSQDSA